LTAIPDLHQGLLPNPEFFVASEGITIKEVIPRISILTAEMPLKSLGSLRPWAEHQNPGSETAKSQATLTAIPDLHQGLLLNPEFFVANEGITIKEVIPRISILTAEMPLKRVGTIPKDETKKGATKNRAPRTATGQHDHPKTRGQVVRATLTRPG
jgi:phage-related holin